MDKKTPYQGLNRQYGFFTCKDCNVSWESCNSFANIGQKCSICMVIVYPHIQEQLGPTSRPRQYKNKNVKEKNKKEQKCGAKL